MVYVKVKNNAVADYPYSVGNLRRDNGNTSFPKQITNEMLAAHGVYPVVFEDAPQIDNRTQKGDQGVQPYFKNEQWVVSWVVTDKSPDEIKEYDNNVAHSARFKRNQLLSDSDWTQVADAPVNATSWATYRQALRDVTNHVNFPYLTDADWPVEPA